MKSKISGFSALLAIDYLSLNDGEA